MSPSPDPAAGPARFAQVVLPLPLASSYTYRIPDPLVGRIATGMRVLVPVRRRELVGVVVSTGWSTRSVKARDILGVLDAEPALPAPLMVTARWMSAYYGAPLGLAVKAMLPAGMWGTTGAAQQQNDVLAANAVFMDAFYTDVRPALAEWRESRGLAADPMAAYAASGYQRQIAADRVGGTQAGWGA